MMNIIAVDTSTEACSVALMFNNEITHDFVISQRDHTKQVLPMLDRLLKQSDYSMSQVDAIAFTKGPGSFTGVRIGIGIAQGLALGIDKPMLAISTLNVLAQGSYRLKGATSVVSAIDARMGDVYLGAYYYHHNQWQPIIDEQVIKPDNVSSQLTEFTVNNHSSYFAGTGWQTYPNMLSGLQDSQYLLPSAQDMLPLAVEKYAKGEIIAVEAVEATYLRNEVTWKKLPGRQ